jgi:parallel beta-helix repeat protein
MIHPLAFRPRPLRFVALACLLLGTAVGWPVLAPAAPPEAPDSAAINTLVEAVQALPLPTPDPLVEGAVYVGVASAERRLQRSFLELQQAQPEWRDEGIVIASGRHRLEVVAESLARPDLLGCADGVCRLTAPLAVDKGAMLIIDGLTVELEQATGSVIIAFGDLFFSAASILGRDGQAAAQTDGAGFRPFIVAYDESRTVIRDSRLAALGFDEFGTTGLSVMTVSRDEPAGHPEFVMVGTLIEDAYEGVFVRGAGKVELLRNTVAGAGRHGLVVRDGSEAVLIAENAVTGSGALAENGNGIVVRGLGRAVLAGNRVEDSAASGIMLERGATEVAVSGNQLVNSGRDGLIIYESGDIAVVGNGIFGSGRSGIRVRASDDISITSNSIERNARAGVDAHDWSAASREPNEEETPLIRPTEVTVTDNRFADNERGDCIFEGVVTVLPAGASDC